MNKDIKYNYNFDENGVYIGATEARLDPLESIAQKKDIYLVPINSTIIKPLAAKEGNLVVWNGKNWTYQSISEEV